MIHVLRTKTDETGKAIEPNGAWFKRAEKWTQKANEERDLHKANTTVYGDDEVRKALERLFQDKCAYCESWVEAFDVDHFRPNGRVAERRDHPGYYWLTYWWENLYPSCVHCNQQRKDRPRWVEQAGLPAKGKYDHFPLLDENCRAMGPEDDIHAEPRLLLDPCFDDPEEYLGYDPTGRVFSLKDPKGNDDNDVASKTIEVFHLKRRRLKDARSDTIKVVTGVTRLLGIIRDGNAAVDALAELQGLLERTQENRSPHAGVARYVIRHRSDFGD